MQGRQRTGGCRRDGRRTRQATRPCSDANGTSPWPGRGRRSLLFAVGHTLAGAITVGLCAAALVARWSAMRKANRGFYGQDKRPA